ncbi:F0F1 ATP synthase subunit delta [Corynebacterium sp. CCUG 71335]|uniref:F0F1 ATP synthase subunit delta n=1 Tax=Corynebacterium sp. CCUG 71335 TaxID=2823892 RepID=UPI002109D343|nr:F0F1 ATP synthase subunit delta [Corynebacterium sp. CCUG 71335]MCQ4618241.1 F0F1 ATP synthase subunit delta [Corynebacterium pseudogenitalium]MCQ4620164.1 F0F1 ATP synthase subunit delta [Corynebacterium sp. CCUG 71335]
MRAASREAQSAVAEKLDAIIRDKADAGESVSVAAQVGTELFLVVDQLDKNRALRIAVADSSLAEEQRVGIMSDIFSGKVAEATLEVLRESSAREWSAPREFREGLVHLGRRALLRGAESENKLGEVESELFQLSRLFERESELTQLLSDRTATTDQKRQLLASVLYGKVSMYTEALALQVVGRPEDNPVDDIAGIARESAELTGREFAAVTAATELTDSQREALAEKLGQIYGREMAIHTEVDPSLLGGVTIRVGDELIDGSTRGKLERMRADMAANTAY